MPRKRNDKQGEPVSPSGETSALDGDFKPLADWQGDVEADRQSIPERTSIDVRKVINRAAANVAEGHLSKIEITQLFLSNHRIDRYDFKFLAQSLIDDNLIDAAWLNEFLIWLLVNGDDRHRYTAFAFLQSYQPLSSVLVPGFITALNADNLLCSSMASELIGHVSPSAVEAAPQLFQRHKRLRLNFSEGNSSYARILRLVLGYYDGDPDKAGEFNLYIDQCNTYNEFLITIGNIKGFVTPELERAREQSLGQPSQADLLSPAAAIRALAPSLPDDFGQRAIALSKIHLEYRQELAKLSEPVLNARLEQASGSTVDDKKTLVKTINEELRLSGLAIRCEVEDKDDPARVAIYPSFLIADTSRNTDTVGRFRLEYQDADGTYRRKSLPSRPNPIELMVAPSRSESELLNQPPQGFTDRFAPVQTKRGSHRQ